VIGTPENTQSPNDWKPSLPAFSQPVHQDLIQVADTFNARL
jgi:hypothetical protein